MYLNHLLNSGILQGVVLLCNRRHLFFEKVSFEYLNILMDLLIYACDEVVKLSTNVSSLRIFDLILVNLL